MINQKILGTTKLPTLSRTLKEMIFLKNNQTKSINTDLEKIILKDPILSAHILKMVNSSFFSFKNKISSISHSIGILGVDNTINIAFSYSTIDLFKTIEFDKKYISIFDHILKKTNLTASIANALAVETEFQDKSGLHLSCQMLYLGQIILLLYSPEEYLENFQFADDDLIKSENFIFKTDFIQIGQELISQWKLPDFLTEGLENLLILNDPKSTINKIIHISHKLSELILLSDNESYNFKEFEEIVSKHFKISQKQLVTLIECLPVKFKILCKEFENTEKSLINVNDKLLKFISNLVQREKEIKHKAKEIVLEKHFLSYLLDVSIKLPSLKTDKTIFNFIFEHFNLTIPDVNIAVLYSQFADNNFSLLKSKSSITYKINQTEFLKKVKKSLKSQPVYILNVDESIKLLGLNNISYVFPLQVDSYCFGYFIASHSPEAGEFVRFESKYISILTSAISNRLLNILNFKTLKNENLKKDLLIREFVNISKKLELSNTEVNHAGEAETTNQILPTIFHKLKNHLTPVLGYSQILSMKIQDPKHLSRLGKIEENANKLVEQLGTLKDYFSVLKINKEDSNLNGILSSMKFYFRELETAYNVRTNLDLDPFLESIPLNKSHIQILVKNICDNSALAIKTKNIKNGLIKVSTKLQKDHIELIIEDNGIGIAENDIGSISKLFYSTFEDHAGLGLSICENILKNHNASISINSKHLKSTQVKIIINSASLKKSSKPIKNDSKKILIVNRNNNTVSLLSEILTIENIFQVTSALSEEEALALLKEKTYDFIFSDLSDIFIENSILFQFLKSTNQKNKIYYIISNHTSKRCKNFLIEQSVNSINDTSNIFGIKEIIKTKLN